MPGRVWPRRRKTGSRKTGSIWQKPTPKFPYELNNLIDDPAYTQVKQELRKKLLKWIRLAENAEPEIVDG